MSDRKQIPIDRDILVLDNTYTHEEVSKSILQEAVDKMEDNEVLNRIYRKSGHEPAPFANDPDETIWVDQIILVARSYRDETDEEYLNRIRLLKLDEERERLQYLRLKAKFEH